MVPVTIIRLAPPLNGRRVKGANATCTDRLPSFYSALQTSLAPVSAIFLIYELSQGHDSDLNHLSIHFSSSNRSCLVSIILRAGSQGRHRIFSIPLQFQSSAEQYSKFSGKVISAASTISTTAFSIA